MSDEQWRVRCARWLLRGTGLVPRTPEPRPIRIERTENGFTIYGALSFTQPDAASHWLTVVEPREGIVTGSGHTDDSGEAA